MIVQGTKVVLGHTTDGYTSGTFNSDEDPCQLGSISGTDGLSEFDPPVTAPGTPFGVSLQTNRTEVTTPTSGSGYSSTDHQPLSELRRARETATTSVSPRKRKRLLSKPGKYMKDAYSKGIQWTRTFVCTTSLIFIACCARLMCRSTQRAPEKFCVTIGQKAI